MKEFTGQLVFTMNADLKGCNHTLVEIAELFRIPIDESRIEDYTLSNVNYEMPSVKIVDRVKGITYRSIISDYSSILGITADPDLKRQVNKHRGGERSDKVIVTVTATDSEFTESIREYALCYRIPFASRIDSYFESDKLSIVKLSKCGLKLPIEDSSSTEIIYTKNFFGKKERSTFSKKVASCGHTYNRTHREETLVSQNERLEEEKKSRFSNTIEGSIYHGMNETSTGQPHVPFSCVCFEDAQKHGELWTSGLKAEQYLELEMLDTLSAFIFKGVDNDINHSLTIYKKSDRFDISYTLGSIGKKGTDVRKLQVPIIRRGKITIEELDLLIESLCPILEGEFGVKVVVELKEFQRRMFPIPINDKTSAKRLSMMSSISIFDEVSANREEMFQALDRELQDFKSIGGILSKPGKQFTILPKKNKQ